MKIAIEGCCHGELDRIYEVLEQVRVRDGIGVDLLICCGDFQAVRNSADLSTMACPQKYRQMNSFYKYYSGEKVAPVLTIFIGGNHEATNHLWELSYGGWVAPKIYYLGNAGVVRFGGVRIAGLSGIYKPNDYGRGRFECPPYNESTKRTAYHVRSCDVFRLKQLSGTIDIMLSHDWPVEMCHYGNTTQLIKIKPYFAEEILDFPSPDHVTSSPGHVTSLPDHVMSFPDHVTSSPGHVTSSPGHVTPPPGHVTPYRLEYDREWLAILKSTEPLMTHTHSIWLPPSPLTDHRHSYTAAADELAEVDRLFNSDFTIPDNFSQTVTPYAAHQQVDHRAIAWAQENSQTTEFCRKLVIPNHYLPPTSTTSTTSTTPTTLTTLTTAAGAVNPDEIPLGETEEEESHDLSHHGNPDEIMLCEDEGDDMAEADKPHPQDEKHASSLGSRTVLSLPPPDHTPQLPEAELRQLSGHLEATPTLIEAPPIVCDDAMPVESEVESDKKVTIKRRNVDIYKQNLDDD